MILYMLLCRLQIGGFPPFNGTSEVNIHSRILRREVEFPDEEWAEVSPEAREVVSLMLQKNPNRSLANTPWDWKYGGTFSINTFNFNFILMHAINVSVISTSRDCVLAKAYSSTLYEKVYVSIGWKW